MSWHRVGRNGLNQGYSITDGQLTLIVPWTEKHAGVERALTYLNSLSERRASGKKVCASCNQAMGKADKFYFRPDGRIEHRHCDRPEVYV